MQRKAFVASIVLTTMAAAIYPWRWTCWGAVRAVIDNGRGAPAIYSLGCVDGPPRDQKQFRIQEILGTEYHIQFHVVGGIGPSPEQVDFVFAYDRVSLQLLLLRYGHDFPQRVERRAAADVAAGLPNSEWKKWFGPPSGSPK